MGRGDAGVGGVDVGMQGGEQGAMGTQGVGAWMWEPQGVGVDVGTLGSYAEGRAGT